MAGPLLLLPAHRRRPYRPLRHSQHRHYWTHSPHCNRPTATSAAPAAATLSSIEVQIPTAVI